MAIDEARLNELLGRFLNDLRAARRAADMEMGGRLGLYRALAAGGSATPAEVAEGTGTAERYVAEWLAGQAAGGYVSYDPATGRYLLTEEQATAPADKHSPALSAAGAQFALSALRAVPAITEAFRTGQGLGCNEHHLDVFGCTERLFRSACLANLTSDWIPALDGAQAKVEAGAKE